MWNDPWTALTLSPCVGHVIFTDGLRLYLCRFNLKGSVLEKATLTERGAS